MNILSPHDVRVASILVTTLNSVGLAMSLVTLVLCVILCNKRHEISGMTIIRVIFLLQILEAMRCLFSLVTVYADATDNAGCRAQVFFTLVLSAAPLNLSVVCMVYFQAILLHKVAVRGRYLRIMLLAGVAAYTIVPPMFTLFIPARTAGMPSYCAFYDAPSRRLFIFKWLVIYIWLSLTCIVGLCSITAMMVAIFRRAGTVKSRICSGSSSGSRAPGQPSSISGELNATVVKESLHRRRRSSGLVVAKTLKSMCWFSIVPIVSFTFNMAYSVVWYRTQQQSLAVFIVDQVLQFLSVPLYCLTFYLNPSVQRALSQYLQDRKGPGCRDVDGMERLASHQSSLPGSIGGTSGDSTIRTTAQATDESSGSPISLSEMLSDEYYTDSLGSSSPTEKKPTQDSDTSP
ncbi:hypothetical protein LPJ61_005072 [Coemansia biformis]|uniref:Uncharacterized protein n=1 Tax=Coemansia biformis TaxID=1286918 RepID=A0A9W8CWM6_9FUNG|nr:hypothetical protein LPJ61_005072 [Coemansia biformis]